MKKIATPNRSKRGKSNSLDITERVHKIIRDIICEPDCSIKNNDNLYKYIKFKSFDIVDLIIELCDEFEIEIAVNDFHDKCKTVIDVIKFIENGA